MAFELHRSAFPGLAASNINTRAALTLASGTDRGLVPVATCNVRPHSIALATALRGEAVTAHDEGNYVKINAGASMGPGAEIGVASTNGALAPVAGASGSVVYSVGQSVGAGVAGEVTTLYVNPRQLSGLV